MSAFNWPAMGRSNSCIRLVKLDGLSSGRRLTAALSSADLDADPGFEALSYVWGEQAAEHSIEMNGANLSVTQTLYTALQYLRHETEPRTLWVDQLCINQTDVDERNGQVALMGRIYSQATKVIVWLGLEQHNDKVIMSVLSKLASLSDLSPAELLEFSRNISAQLGDVTHKLSMGIVSATKSHADMELHYLSDLFGGYHWIWNMVLSWLENKWFDRVWCFQEAVLALQCELAIGSLRLPWDVLYRACSTISKSGLRFVLGNRHIPALVVHSWRRCLQTRSDQPIDLVDLVGALRGRQASVPHDKIYGLLGLVKMSGSNAIDVAIDYNAPFQQVYTDLVKTTIEHYKSLAVLSHVQRQIDPSLPSWCPDWRQEPRSRHYLGSGCSLLDISYRASAGSITSTNSLESAFGTLQLRGCPIGRILRKADVEETLALGFAFRNRQFTDKRRWTSMYWIGLYAKALRASEVPFDAGYFKGRSDRFLTEICRGHLVDALEPTVRLTFALWRTLAADMLPGSGRSTTSGKDSGQRHTFAAYFAWQGNGNSSNAPAEVFQEYEDWAVECTTGRSVVLVEDLERRHHFALVPEHVEPDDDVVLLQGGAAPFATRKLRGQMTRHQLLGECYLDGIMDGEWMEVADRLNLWQHFTFI